VSVYGIDDVSTSYPEYGCAYGYVAAAASVYVVVCVYALAYASVHVLADVSALA